MAYSGSVVAEAGRFIALYLGTGASPDTFVKVAGLRTTDLSINGNPVDITNKGSGGWRELLPGAGITQIDIGASGVFSKGDAKQAALLTAVINSPTSPVYIHAQILTGAGDTFTGWWVVASLKRSGTHNDAEMYDLSLQSTGPIAYVMGA